MTSTSLPGVRQRARAPRRGASRAGEPAKAAANPRPVRQVADGDGCEAPVRAEVARLPRAARHRDEVLRVRVDGQVERRVGARDERAELDEIVANAVARRGDEGGDPAPGGRGFAGRNVLGAHRAQPSRPVSARAMSCDDVQQIVDI